MKVIAEDSDFRYILFESPRDVDTVRIENFGFFRIYGVNEYRDTFKVWLRKFPRPIFIGVVRGDELVAWEYTDHLKEEGITTPVNVLRAIEVREDHRNRKIGKKLLSLACIYTPGYLITKPITRKSEDFFRKMGFVEIEKYPIFSKFHYLRGYLVLPLSRKMDLIFEIPSLFVKVSV